MTKPVVVLVAALDRNYAIGKGNDLPWRLPDDGRSLFGSASLQRSTLAGRYCVAATRQHHRRPLC